MTLRVYLSGPINGCSDEEALGWRAALKAAAPWVEWVDPMVRDYRGREHESPREIVEQDKRDIRRCDLVVVNAWRPSVGTSMETYYAHSIGVPTVVIEHPNLSPWLRAHATYLVDSLGSALNVFAYEAGE